MNVRSYVRKSVTISGAVNTPGTYVISRGETLSSLIEKAEGYKDDAYPFGGVLNNKRAEVINAAAVDKLYTSFVQKLISKGDALFASESLPFILAELKKSTISGRIMAEFDIDVINANPELDTNLEDGDSVIIPISTQQIYIFGEVNNPGAIRYKPGQSIQEYSSIQQHHKRDTLQLAAGHPQTTCVSVHRTPPSKTVYDRPCLLLPRRT